MAIAPETIKNIQRLLAVAQSPSSPPADRAKAQQALVALWSNPETRAEVGPILTSAGASVVNGQLVFGQSGRSPAGAGSGPAGQGPIGWGDITKTYGPPSPASIVGSGQRGENSMGYGNEAAQPSGNMNDPLYNPATGDVGGSAVGTPLGNTTAGDPAALGSGGAPGTFFGNVQGTALDALTANPNSAWRLYQARGGPNGGSLANSTASKYGANDFQSAMQLAPLLGGSQGSGLSNQGTLQFTNDWMKQATSGGGNYMDPSKILSAALNQAAAAPDLGSQEAIIQGALQAVEPYMDPVSYQMLMSRIDKVMNDYLAYGLENGQQDLSGMLLKQVSQAMS